MKPLLLEAKTGKKRLEYYNAERLAKWTPEELQLTLDQIVHFKGTYYDSAHKIKGRMNDAAWKNLALFGEKNLFEQEALKAKLEDLHNAWKLIYRRRKNVKEKNPEQDEHPTSTSGSDIRPENTGTDEGHSGHEQS